MSAILGVTVTIGKDVKSIERPDYIVAVVRLLSGMAGKGMAKLLSSSVVSRMQANKIGVYTVRLHGEKDGKEYSPVYTLDKKNLDAVLQIRKAQCENEATYEAATLAYEARASKLQSELDKYIAVEGERIPRGRNRKNDDASEDVI